MFEPWVTVVVIAVLSLVGVAVNPARSAPIQGKPAMAVLTPDDKKPIQISERADIKHEAREHFIKGYQAQKAADYKTAVSHYQSAISSNPDMYEAFWNLGLCLEWQGQYPEAQEAFATALKIDWSNPLIYKHLAFLSFQQGKMDEGQDYLNKYLHR
jgi:tetratricopeptide (TPR) repeat protein